MTLDPPPPRLWDTDHGYDAAIQGLETSLKKLKVDYLDLYLIHSPNTGVNANGFAVPKKLWSFCYNRRRKACGNMGRLDSHAETGQNSVHWSVQLQRSALGSFETTWTSNAHRQSDRDASHEVPGLGRRLSNVVIFG